MRYNPVQVNVDEKQEDRLKKAIEKRRGVTLIVTLNGPKSKTVLLTKGQIQKMERDHLVGKSCSEIRMSPPQVKANTEHHGGFLWTLAARLAPAILSGIASAAAKNIAGRVMKRGRGLYLQKNGQCGQVQLVNGGGLYLSPHPKFHGGEGLFETEGSEIKGDGLLLGENSPFKNVPLLNILL